VFTNSGVAVYDLVALGADVRARPIGKAVGLPFDPFEPGLIGVQSPDYSIKPFDQVLDVVL
jgi:hypothetical protein